MNRIAAFVSERTRLAWAIALIVVVAFGIGVGLLIRDLREGERLSLLTTEAERRGIEIMSATLNGNVMGALSLLGLVEEDIKPDAKGMVAPNGPRMSRLLEALSRSHGADGVFVVGADGVVRSSWDSSGKPSTGLDVSFRPYFRMAMQRHDTVYAAVSLARGDRALYFATPVFAGTDHDGEEIGAVVARTGLARVDSLLKGKTDLALLLSPQGVVFAGSRAEWIGALAGTPSPERLKSIRDLKQFGALFDTREPMVLPIVPRPGIQVFDGRRYALASAQVQWNDPSGDWTLLLMEDLSRTVPLAEPLRDGAAGAAVLLLIAVLVLGVLRGQYAQALAHRRIEAYGRDQAAGAERTTRRAEAALRFQRAKSIDDLAGLFLAEAHRILGALQGMVYVRDGSSGSPLRLAAAYACSGRIPPTLEPGQGLLGQCLLDREIRILETTDHESWTIRSGLGDCRPAAVMIAPVLLDESALGVVEIAVLDPPDRAARQQFDELVSLLALNLEILRHHRGAATVTAEAPS